MLQTGRRGDLQETASFSERIFEKNFL